MAKKTRYVSKTKVVLEVDDGSTMQLIYGDAVVTTGAAADGHTPVTFRGRVGSLPTAALGDVPLLECYFLDVGQGDATLIVTPKRKKILIDGGKAPAAGRIGQAEQALTWMYRLDEVDEPVTIDLVVLTHADEDHIGGLVNLIRNPKIKVKKVVHSGIATFNAPKADDQLGVRQADHLLTRHSTLEDLDDHVAEGLELSEQFSLWAAALGLEHGLTYQAVQRGDTLSIGDAAVKIEVLGPVLDELPDGTLAFPWFDDRGHTINGHSVVLRITCGDVKILLPGDLNVDGAKRLLADSFASARLDAHVLKAPHHGSHEFTVDFLQAVNPQLTTISSGEIPDHGHPRANFLGAVGQSSRGTEPLLFSTALSAVFGSAGFAAGDQATVDANGGTTPEENSVKRELFRKLLPGIINVRTNGKDLFAATRVQASYWWVTFPDAPVERSLP